MILRQLLDIIFVILVFISVAWIPLGLISTVIFVFMYIYKKKSIYKKIAILGLFGIPATIIVFLGYFFLNLILNLIGIPNSNAPTLPLIK